MSTTLRQIASWVNGELHGDGDLAIEAARTLEHAGPADITFADERHVDQLHHHPSLAAIVPMSAKAAGKPLIRVHDPLSAFALVFERFQPKPPLPAPSIHAQACVHETATIGRDVRIEPFAVVGACATVGENCVIKSGAVVGANCRLGDHVVLHPHVVLYDNTVVGNNVVIHAHASIGADGFGYRFVDGKHVKIPQMGNVVIEDDVEIGAGSTIDRGTFGPTRIGKGTKIDNLVQVGHNCRIGSQNILVSQCGIAGSSRTGDHVIIAGQAGICDHVQIGDRVVIGPQAGVTKDVGDGERLLGSPAVDDREFKVVTASTFKLPEIRRSIRRILKHLNLSERETG